MGNIYNSLKNLFQNLLRENKVNSAFIPTLLVLISIHLSTTINNIAIGIFVFSAFIYFKKTNFSFQLQLILPILLYGLMSLSFFWSINKETTWIALGKEIRDEFTYHGFDWKDLLFTMIPAITIFLLNLSKH